MKLKYLRRKPSTYGLVFHAPLDNGFLSGAVVQDTTNSYTATASGGTGTPTPSYPGFDFVAASTQFIDIGACYNGVKTSCCWVKCDSVAAVDTFFDLQGTDYLLHAVGTVTKFGFAGGTAVLYTDAVAAAATITAGKWYHVAVTDTSGKNASDFDIGRVAAFYMNGYIGDMRLYNRVLSAEEIRSIYELERYKYKK